MKKISRTSRTSAATCFSALTLLQLWLVVTSVGFLDIDDLKHSQFEISIQAKPVLIDNRYDNDLQSGDSSLTPKAASNMPDNHIILGSKYGQLYQCALPADAIKEDGETSKAASAKDVIKLLGPLKHGPCLFYTKGWWSYEFCYGLEIKQYHFENGAIQGDIIYLGKFESDYNWTKTEEGEAAMTGSKGKTKQVQRKYHSQYYVNGSHCELMDDLRKTEVRFKCDEKLGVSTMDVISEIEEPSTCTYLFTISTNRLCSHPRFKEEKSGHASPISCSPALSKKEYEKYTRLQEKTSKRVKEVGERLRNLNAKYELKKQKLAEQDSSSKLSPTMEKFYKEVYSPNKLKTKVTSEEVTPVTEDVNKVVSQEVTPEEATVEEEEDEDVKAFRKEARTLTEKESKAAKKTIASALKDQFEDIYTEAKEELEKETGQELDPDTEKEKAALDTLTKTLNKLLDQLDKTEKQLDTTGKGLTKSLEGKEKWWKKHSEKSVLEKNQKEGKMAHDEEEDLAEWIKKTIEKDDKGSKESSSSSEDPKDNLVKVRISKISKPKGDSNTKGMQPVSIDEEEEKKLSKAVQDELEKAGLLDTQGRQVEVRIVTTGFFEDEDENGVHTLTQGDSSHFKTLLKSLLGANSQQITEEYRKTQLQSNYQFVWNGDGEEEEDAVMPTDGATFGDASGATGGATSDDTRSASFGDTSSSNADLDVALFETDTTHGANAEAETFDEDTEDAATNGEGSVPEVTLS